MTTMLLLLLLLYITTCFLGCSCVLYPHRYFEDTSERCLGNSSCNETSSANFSISRNCQCDVQCAIYGDCCQDSPHFSPSSLSKCVRAGDWNTAADYMDYYYMVTSCPASWLDKKTRYRCEKYMETIRSEPIFGHPVTNSATNITYANYHCARCNNALQISTMIRWKLAVTCDANLTLPIPHIDTVLSESKYGEDSVLIPKFANASYHTCKLYVWRPFEFLRRCHKRTVDTCPLTWKNDTVRSHCESYTYFVFRLGNTPYRNPHCATCNGVTEKSMKCIKNNLEIETNFPILFDFSDKSTDKVGKKRICPDKNEAYDPVARICRHIIWSMAGEIGDYEFDDCNENISSCNIQNCSRFVLEPDEYEMNDNFTVTDLLSNEIYSKFKIMGDGRLELCAKYQITEEKFDGAMRYLTFLGLGVSMGFMFLHLVAFFTSPVLRNLSGKNLASLCGALILAYGAFIIGQLLEVGGTACKVTAAVTYFSFLSSFSWLLLIAFDVWRTLRLSTVHLRVVSRESRRYVFGTYSTLGWFVIPGIFVSSLLAMEHSSLDSTFRPGLGVHNCWFGNRKALIVFFAVPVGLIMALNIGFFISSAHMICSSSMSSTNKSSSTRRDYRLFARLALLMGLTWLMGFIADLLNLKAVWYIFVALNAFQGLFIFLAFTWTKKVRNGVRSQISGDSKSTNYVEQDTSCWSRPSKSRTVSTEATT